MKWDYEPDYARLKRMLASDVKFPSPERLGVIADCKKGVRVEGSQRDYKEAREYTRPTWDVWLDRYHEPSS